MSKSEAGVSRKAASARIASALVTAMALCGRESALDKATLSCSATVSGSSRGSWPRRLSSAAVRLAAGSGRVTRTRMAQLQLAKKSGPALARIASPAVRPIASASLRAPFISIS